MFYKKLPKAFDASRAVPEVMDTVRGIRSGIAEAIAEWRSMPENILTADEI